MMFLEVAADNEAALALYAALGFSPAGRRFRYYERSHGPRVDAIILRSPLPLPATAPGNALPGEARGPN
jgi:ribosomal-protein-alanine N-acetyltransferase